MPKTLEAMPRQAIPRSQKNEDWQKRTMDSIIGETDFSAGRNSRRWFLRKAYDYYNGIIDDEDYTHVLKPYGKARKNFPAKLHNYPIIKPFIDLLLGEKVKRPLTYSVTVSNPDVITEKEKAKSKRIEEVLTQQFINALNEAGVPTGQPTQETEDLPQVVESFDRTYKDNRAIMGQNALQYIIQSQEVKRKFSEGWFHWLVSGMVVSRRDVEHNEPTYEVLNPLQVDFDHD